MERLVLNQKAYFTSLKEIEEFQNKIDKYKNSVIVIPSNIYLENYIKKGYKVGCQDVSDYKSGPHTGEVCAKALKDLGVSYVLVGHSELREKYKLSQDVIVSKTRRCLEEGLNVILCIGESLKEKEQMQMFKVIDDELKGVDKSIIISYEPIWSIGSDLIPSFEEIMDIISYIKSKGFKKVLYGGSINERTINELKDMKGLDGFLVGSASVSFENVIKMIEVLSE